jgi:acyl-CoA hydrolase
MIFYCVIKMKLYKIFVDVIECIIFVFVGYIIMFFYRCVHCFNNSMCIVIVVVVYLDWLKDYYN